MSDSRRVKLFQDWRGYHKGETINVTKVTAQALIDQNMAEYAYFKKSEKEMKDIKNAPRDKMLRGAPITKIK